MGLYERAEKILAGSGNSSVIATWLFNRNWWWIVHRTVYLHVILNYDAPQARFRFY